MKKAYVLLAVFALGIAILLLAPIESPTGQTWDSIRVFNLHDTITSFYNIEDFVFPPNPGACSIIPELFYQTTVQQIKVSSHFTTNGVQRISSYVFGLDESVGSLDMIKGKGLVAGTMGGNARIILEVETIPGFSGFRQQQGLKG